ncbi:MAG TPA: mechanosensitive ion channel family protein [Blastocatellia bacterium]|nr:mechanosensitive ion channel family protein [Blastocatellia bacterium]
MHFWQIVETTSGAGSSLYWLIFAFIFVAVTLFLLAPTERNGVRAAVLLLAFSLAGLLAGSAIIYFGGSGDSFGFRFLRFVSLFLVSVGTINLVAVLIFAVLLRPLKLPPPRILRDLLVALAYIAAGIALLSRSGVDVAGVVATSAVITAIIGFSLQDTLGNIMGGLALQMEHTIHVGDWVRIDQQEGQVKEIRWRQTAIETRNWDTVVIPNGVLMKSQVVVLGRRVGQPRQHRQWVYFNVDFRYAPTQVIATVEKALCAEAIPDVASHPPPHCLVVDFKDSYAVYAARYWLTDLAQTDPTDSVVRARIYSALRRADIPLSMPAQALFLTQESESRRERKRDEEIARRLDALAHIELFQPLSDEEKHRLAARLRPAPFVRGEVMTRQGDEAHWLYVIVEGEAEVQLKIEGRTEKVAVLGSGDYFGEMGMMTGEARRATVVARSDVKCYRLDKTAFHDIIHDRPEIAEAISHTLAKRRVELEAIRESLTEEIIRQRMQHTQRDLLRRIRDFFKLDADLAAKP